MQTKWATVGVFSLLLSFNCGLISADHTESVYELTALSPAGMTPCCLLKENKLFNKWGMTLFKFITSTYKQAVDPFLVKLLRWMMRARIKLCSGTSPLNEHFYLLIVNKLVTSTSGSSVLIQQYFCSVSFFHVHTFSSLPGKWTLRMIICLIQVGKNMDRTGIEFISSSNSKG